MYASFTPHTDIRHRSDMVSGATLVLPARNWAGQFQSCNNAFEILHVMRATISFLCTPYCAVTQLGSPYEAG